MSITETLHNLNAIIQLNRVVNTAVNEILKTRKIYYHGDELDDSKQIDFKKKLVFFKDKVENSSADKILPIADCARKLVDEIGKDPIELVGIFVKNIEINETTKNTEMSFYALVNEL